MVSRRVHKKKLLASLVLCYFLSLLASVLYRLLAADLWAQTFVSIKSLNHKVSSYILRLSYSLVRVQKKVSEGLKLLQYYTTKTWEFKNERIRDLNKILTPMDRETFDIYVDQWNFEEYIKTYIIGMRQFLLKESPDTLPKAKKLLTRLYIMHLLTQFIVIGSIFWFLWARIDGIFAGIEGFFSLPFKLLKR